MIHPTQSTGFTRFLLQPILVFTRWYGAHFSESLVKMRYYFRFKKKLNLSNPRTLNEKILYMSLRTDTTSWTRLADKYAVREYVCEKGLEEILIPNLGYWNNIDEFSLEHLPNQFVLKTTHGSGDIMLVKNKNDISNNDIKIFFKPYLSKRYGALEGGKHYLRIKPALIAESLMINDKDSLKYSTSIIDYKIWCFNGKPYFIWVCCNRDKYGTDVMTYDTDWNVHPEYSIFNSDYRQGQLIPQPNNLSKMLDVASKLSEGFPVVRVDLYNLEGKILFGEMTFTSLGGLMNFYSEEFQNLAGNLIKL